MERYEEIERSIITTYRKRIWRKFIQGIKEFEMIQEIMQKITKNVCLGSII